MKYTSKDAHHLQRLRHDEKRKGEETFSQGISPKKPGICSRNKENKSTYTFLAAPFYF